MKQWKRLAALSSAIVMAAATLTYFPNDTLQNIRLEISASADETGADETSAATWTKTESDGLTWTLYADGTLTISGTGAMKDYDYDDNSDNRSPVCDNQNITKVVIEDGVTSIGNYAFFYCTGLTSITIPDSVTSIRDSVFYSCTSLTNITIPDSVTSIGDGMFSNCWHLTSITIPESVTSIGTDAFAGCYDLTSITIPESVTSIGTAAFSGCGLTSITIPESVTSIRDYMFSDCGSLTSITIPDSVTSIGNDAFQGCTVLTSIILPENVTSIGSYAFAYTGLKSITIPDSVTNIGNYAFAGCKDLTSITIPDSVTSIGNYAFYNCSSLTSITIPDSVTSIGTATFSGCKNLTSITIPDSVTSIGNFAFNNCDSLQTISLGCGSALKRSDFGKQGDLVSYASHILKKTEAKDATCTEDGNKEYWTCEHCGKYFLSDDSNPETAKAVELSETVIPASHKLTKVEAKAATCTENGNKEYWTCEHCKKYFLSDDTNPETAKAVEQAETVISASHKLTKVEAKAATCTEDGNKEYWTCEHCKKYFLSDDTNPETAKAVEQSETIIPASHKLTKVEAKAATCTEDGNKEYWTCEHCKKYFLSDDTNPETAKAVELSETVIPASHKLTKVEAKDATYAENGNKAYWTCEHCKKYFLSDDTNPETATAVELSETVIPALVQVATATTPIKCVYGQDMNKIDLRNYVKNTDVVGEVTVKVATGSTLPDGMKLDNGKISGKPAKAYEDSKEVTFTFTAENGSTANLTLLFLVEKADPTVEVAVSGDSHTEGDLVSELKLILSENSTKGVVELVSEIKALVAGKNTFTWKFTPEDENNYHTVTGTVVVNAQTTTTTTKATTTTTKATTTTKPSKTTTTKATTTTKPNKTTTTKATTTTKPNKTTTTKATTTTKPSKTTTTKATTTTKPSKTTTTKATTTTKPSKTTTTNVTTTTKPNKTTTTKATTTTKPSKTTTTNATTTTKPSKTTTTNATTTTKPNKTTTTKVTTTTKPNKTTTTKVTTTTKPSKTTTTKTTTTNTATSFYGDVNLDGKVDILDAVYLNKYLATLIQFSDAQMANADCCQDGVLNDQDTTALMQFIILLIDDLPVQPTEK